MIYEFEGKTEQEAIDLAKKELSLSEDQFDIEILEAEASFFFKKGKVKIKVYPYSEDLQPRINKGSNIEASGDLEQSAVNFLEKALRNMGFEASVFIRERKDNRILLDIKTSELGRIIGKQGKNINALQILLSSYLKKFGDASAPKEGLFAIIDVEEYRNRREEKLVQLALEMASSVQNSKTSQLLEPMNPFERRLVHMALSDNDSVMTMSEGDGRLRQIRIIYKGSNVC